MSDSGDPFLVTSKVGIANTLRSMAKQNTMVHVSKAGTTSGKITAVLDVDTKKNVFTLDYTSDKVFNQHLTKPGNIHFNASVDSVKIQFSIRKAARTVQFENRPAFELEIPEEIYRIQRREHFRIEIPVSSNVELVAQDDTKKSHIFKLKDISAGGLALLDPEDKLPGAEIGKLYRGCNLSLEELGQVKTDLTVRRVSNQGANPEKQIKVVACQFTNMSNADQIIVQNYIGRLERQQNARLRGFD